MASVTLATLRTRAKTRADMTNSSFLADSEWNSFINSSLDDLYDLLIQKFGDDYYLSESALTTIAGTQNYALPADFYKLVEVDLTVNGFTQPLKRWEFKERGGIQQLVATGSTVPRYRLVGSNLRLYPVPVAVQTGTIYYVPVRTQLVADGDPISFPGGWEDYAVLDAAIKALNKEESDVSALVQERNQMIARIEAAASNRDTGNPARVIDLDRPVTGYGYWLPEDEAW